MGPLRRGPEFNPIAKCQPMQNHARSQMQCGLVTPAGRASAWASSTAASGRSGPSPASLGTPEAGAGGLRAAKGEAPSGKAFRLAGPTWKAPACSVAGSGLRGGGSRRGHLGDRARAWGGTWGAACAPSHAPRDGGRRSSTKGVQRVKESLPEPRGVMERTLTSGSGRG